jgi:hypothetical protein
MKLKKARYLSPLTEVAGKELFGLWRRRRDFVLAMVLGIVITSMLLCVVTAVSDSVDFGPIAFSDSNSTTSFAVPPGAELSHLQLRVNSTVARAHISLYPFCSTYFCSVLTQYFTK